MRRSGLIGPRRVLLHWECHGMAKSRSRFHAAIRSDRTTRVLLH